MASPKLIVLPIALLLSATSFAIAEWHAIGAVTAVHTSANGVELEAGNARVRVIAMSPTVVRVHYAPDGKFPPEHSVAVVSQTGFSPPAVHVNDGPAALEFSTAAIRVRIEKSSMRIIFLSTAGDVILQDDPRQPPAWNGKEFRVWKSMPEDEHYFGLGEKAGPLDHRSQAFTNWNTDASEYQEGTDPLYKSIPFFIGLRRAAYGLFLDNTYRTSFDFGRAARDRFSFGAEGGELDYYFFYGPEPRKVIEDYTALTGRTPLPPLFALGFQQSRYSYETEARVREIASQFRQRKIPADVLYMDIDYQENKRPFTIDRERFPHFREMVSDLARQGFKLVLITDLHIAKFTGYRPYEEGMAHDYFVKSPDGSVYVGEVWPGSSVFPEFTRSDVRQWWGTLYRDFLNDGVRGFWNDMNEPAIFQRPDKTMPLDTVHRSDRRVTDHREVHNIFGFMNACATNDGLLRLRPDERPLVLTRAAYAGAQRCAATWTGDNSSTWNHLRISVPMLLNLGVSGYAFVGADVGGFAGSPPPDLLTRWIELGAFYPFFRDHTDKGSANQEPWVHGSEHEAIRRRYIELRYELLPYVYTSMEETARTGVPLMRPMFLEFPGEASLLTTDSEFMFGPALLVVPQLTERLDPVRPQLPQGIWYDFWTGETLKGGRSLSVKPPLDVEPLYVRGGSIIPEQAVIQYVGEIPQGPLRLHVYPGPNCKGSVYADDGNTFAYQHGEFQRTSLTCEATDNTVQIKVAAPQGSYKPWWRSLEVILHGAEARPSSVTIGAGSTTWWSYDPNTHTVTLSVQAGVATEIVTRY